MRSTHFAPAMGLAVALICGTRPALAQGAGFADRHQLVIGAERLTGFYITSGSTELDGTIGTALQAPYAFDSDDSSTRVTFLGGGLAGEPASFPRLGADFFIIDHVSAGGSLSYASRADESDIQTQTGPLQGSSVEEESSSLLSLNLRGGYGLMFSKLLGVWGRGGVTYTSLTQEFDSVDDDDSDRIELDASLFALSLDAQLIASPLDQVAFSLGPQLDIPLSGSVEASNTELATNVDGDVSILTFGVSAGMLVWF